MAYLLGAAAVMESLQKDVRDVQSCTLDIISRVGPVQCTSWKFPDKQASVLDIEDLLDLYSYSDDEEERQVAHIALYELLIDRLVLLLHTLSNYTENIMKMVKTETPAAGTGTSVGVVVKKYWSYLSHLQQAVKHNIQEKNALSRKVHDLEEECKRLDTDLKQSYQTNRPKTGGFGGIIPPNRAEMITGLSVDPARLKEFGLIARDEYNKACQTSETAFTPCDSCSMTQKALRQSGDIVVAICLQQQVPSCLQKFRPQVSHLDWLSGNDVLRWAAEQNKDLQRISKLTATIKPLKEELNDCTEKSEKLEKRVNNFDRDLKRERDDRAALHREYEKKIKTMELQHKQTLELEQEQRNLIESNKQELERLLSKQKNELEEKQSLLKDMELTKGRLEEELCSSKMNNAEVDRLQRELTSLQGKLDDVSTKMDLSAKDLQREQTKNKSVSKHTQSLQSKHDALLIRTEVLDEENRDLKDQLGELEEEKEKIEESMEELKREIAQKEKLLKGKESDIEQLCADKESLEQSMETVQLSVQTLTDRLEEMKEQERLLVEYPDINGPVNPDLTGTGDIVLDMENQVKANIIRIQLLEKQNEGLRNSVRKLQTLQAQQDRDQHVEDCNGGDRWATHVQRVNPQPLWDTSAVHVPRHEEHFYEPEYSNMENMYNQSTQNSKKTSNQSTANQGIWNQGYVKTRSANIPKSSTGVHDIVFDESALGSRTSPQKDKSMTGHRPLSGKKAGQEVIVGKGIGSRPSSAKVKGDNSRAKSRPSSGKEYMAPVNANSISAYLQLKKAGKLNMPGRKADRQTDSGAKPHVIPQQSDRSEEYYVKQENFICNNCDKMYTKHRDLEIHMSYCTG